MSTETVAAFREVKRKLALGLPVSDAELTSILYAVAVALDEAGCEPLRVTA